LEHFQWLGWIAVGAGIISIWLASRVHVKDVRSPVGALPAKEIAETPIALEI